MEKDYKPAPNWLESQAELELLRGLRELENKDLPNNIIYKEASYDVKDGYVEIKCSIPFYDFNKLRSKNEKATRAIRYYLRRTILDVVSPYLLARHFTCRLVLVSYWRSEEIYRGEIHNGSWNYSTM